MGGGGGGEVVAGGGGGGGGEVVAGGGGGVAVAVCISTDSSLISKNGLSRIHQMITNKS